MGIPLPKKRGAHIITELTNHPQIPSKLQVDLLVWKAVFGDLITSKTSFNDTGSLGRGETMEVSTGKQEGTCIYGFIII